MQTLQQLLAQKLARLETVLSQMRALNDEYMPLKYESVELKEEIEKLETAEQEVEQAEDDKRFDEIIDGWDKQALKDADIQEVEIGQLIDEIKNPEDYANFDTKDLESSQ